MNSENIRKIHCSLPFPPFSSNCYLIKTAKKNILFDCGIKSEDFKQIMDKEISDFGGIDALILSHGHLDHAGLANYLSEKYDVPVFASFNERERISANFNQRVEKRLNKIIKLLKLLGFDTKTTEREKEKIAYYKDMMEPVELIFNINNFSDSEIKLIETPGHTSGSTSMFFETENTLFSGDAVLSEGISPFFDVEHFENSLEIYLKSLKKLENLSPIKTCPGHGEVIEHTDKVIKSHIDYVNVKSSEILKLFRANNDFFSIYQALYPPKYNILIALSEIVYAINLSGIDVLQNLKDLLQE